MHVCVPVGVCVCVSVNECVFMWRPKVDAVCLPQFLHLPCLFKTASLREPGAYLFS